jgi:chitodextrinase
MTCKTTGTGSYAWILETDVSTTIQNSNCGVNRTGSSGLSMSFVRSSDGKTYTATFSAPNGVGTTYVASVTFLYSGTAKSFNLPTGQYNWTATCESGTEDTSPPSNFTASYSNVTHNSVDLIMRASDNSGQVIYMITGNPNIQDFQLQGASGVEVRRTVSLSPDTYYTFAIMPTDEAGNIDESENGVVILDFTTLAIDNESPQNFTAVSGTVTHNSIEILLNANDNSGSVSYSITYPGLATPITATSPSGTQKSVIIQNLTPETPYQFSITAKDAQGNEAGPIALPVSTIAAPANTMCSGESSEKSEGTAFLTGYKYNFSTTGTTVNISVELLDNRTGVNANLQNRTGGGLTETGMTYNASTKTATGTIVNQTIGQNVRFSVKFAFAGGMSVTKIFDYTVGDNCLPEMPDDEEAPENFTATQGAVTHKTIAIKLNATDNSGIVLYTISGGFPGSPVTVQGNSGEQTSFNITGLTASTEYSFSITAKDVAGNEAENSPIVLSITTLEGVVNTDCYGETNQASEGTFPSGYGYSFSTSGTNVNISIEFFDNFSGVWTYFHNYTSGGLAETVMTYNGSTRVATITLPGQTSGTDLIFEVKIAFSGGAAITKRFTYTVGDDCTTDIKAPTDFSAVVGEVTENSIEVIMNAADNSGFVVYVITGDFPDSPIEVQEASGVEKIYVIEGVAPDTEYVFSVSVKDLSGNENLDPQILFAQTLPATDATPPSDFSAEIGEVTENSIEILLNATDESDCVVYEITYSAGEVEETETVSGTSGQSSFVIEELDENTQYSISVKVKDCAENWNETEIPLTATTFTTGLNGINAEEISIYPNPVISELTILNCKENSKIEICDISGRIVTVVQNSKNTINVNTLPQGIYFIKIDSFKTKFIKQ